MLSLILIAGLYFIVGLIQDFILTWQTVSVVEEKAWSGAITSIVNTLMAIFVIVSLFELDPFHKWFNGIAYAVGGGVGVGLTIWFKKKGKRYDKKLTNEVAHTK